MSRDLECGVAGLAIAFRLKKAEMRMRFLDTAVFAENTLCLGLTADRALSALACELELVPTLITLAVRAQYTLDDVHFVAKLILRETSSAERRG